MRRDILISSIGAAGTAAALTSFLDPKHRRRRHAFVRDKTLHLAKGAGVGILGSEVANSGVGRLAQRK